MTKQYGSMRSFGQSGIYITMKVQQVVLQIIKIKINIHSKIYDISKF